MLQCSCACIMFNFKILFLIIGKTESLKDKLHSILAQLEYQHRLKQWEECGVDFRTYLYVPEVHPETQDVFYEREDEAHVLKVIIQCALMSCISIKVLHLFITCNLLYAVISSHRELLATHGLVDHQSSIWSTMWKQRMTPLQA